MRCSTTDHMDPCTMVQLTPDYRRIVVFSLCSVSSFSYSSSSFSFHYGCLKPTLPGTGRATRWAVWVFAGVQGKHMQQWGDGLRRGGTLPLFKRVWTPPCWLLRWVKHTHPCTGSGTDTWATTTPSRQGLGERGPGA